MTSVTISMFRTPSITFLSHCSEKYHLPLKGAFTHTVYACVFRNAVRFPSTDVGSFMSMETNIITSKTQRNAENACVNGMWQLGFSLPLKKKLVSNYFSENCFSLFM